MDAREPRDPLQVSFFEAAAAVGSHRLYLAAIRPYPDSLPRISFFVLVVLALHVALALVLIANLSVLRIPLPHTAMAVSTAYIVEEPTPPTESLIASPQPLETWISTAPVAVDMPPLELDPVLT